MNFDSTKCVIIWLRNTNSCGMFHVMCTYEVDKMVKVKESRNRPGVAQRVPGDLGSQIPRHSAHEGGEVVSLTASHTSRLHPQEMFLVLIFTRG
jgi:hypothetical protein